MQVLQKRKNMFDWAKELNCAITVCDKEGIVLYMNEKSIITNGDVLGQNLFGCHNPRSQEIIRRLLEKGETNSYTISKKGEKKLIYQTPWYQQGEIAGLVEFSIVIPEEMPHYIRGAQ